MHLPKCSKQGQGVDASQLAGNACLTNISSSTVQRLGFKAAQCNRLKRIQSYLMPLPQLQGVPLGSARDTLYYSSYFACLFKGKHHHFFTISYSKALISINRSPTI